SWRSDCHSGAAARNCTGFPNTREGEREHCPPSLPRRVRVRCAAFGAARARRLRSRRRGSRAAVAKTSARLARGRRSTVRAGPRRITGDMDTPSTKHESFKSSGAGDDQVSGGDAGGVSAGDRVDGPSVEPAAPIPRDRADLCPGARRAHVAADGAIGRLRFPGGFLPAPGFEVLGGLADNCGDRAIHLTSRGSVQIRGLRDVSGFADAAEDAGMLPYPEHDRVRNILMSPMTGRVGGLTDVSELVQDFDAALCSDEALASLPGRTLFAFDDGRGDVIVEAPDLGLVALGGDEFELIVAGKPCGVSADRDHAVELLMTATRAWARLRGDAWRIAESDKAEEV